MTTTDDERDWVLRQNAMLPPALYQRLRRCVVCLEPQCADSAACRTDFDAWTRAKWAKELEKASVAAGDAETPRFFDGH